MTTPFPLKARTTSERSLPMRPMARTQSVPFENEYERILITTPHISTGRNSPAVSHENLSENLTIPGPTPSALDRRIIPVMRHKSKVRRDRDLASVLADYEMAGLIELPHRVESITEEHYIEMYSCPNDAQGQPDVALSHPTSLSSLYPKTDDDELYNREARAIVAQVLAGIEKVDSTPTPEAVPTPSLKPVPETVRPEATNTKENVKETSELRVHRGDKVDTSDIDKSMSADILTQLAEYGLADPPVTPPQINSNQNCTRKLPASLRPETPVLPTPKLTFGNSDSEWTDVSDTDDQAITGAGLQVVKGVDRQGATRADHQGVNGVSEQDVKDTRDQDVPIAVDVQGVKNADGPDVVVTEGDVGETGDIYVSDGDDQFQSLVSNVADDILLLPMTEDDVSSAFESIGQSEDDFETFDRL